MVESCQIEEYISQNWPKMRKNAQYFFKNFCFWFFMTLIFSESNKKDATYFNAKIDSILIWIGRIYIEGGNKSENWRNECSSSNRFIFVSVASSEKWATTYP